MATVISLLLLAVSLLQTVKDNPNLPPQIQEQAITLSMEIIQQANTLQQQIPVATSTVLVPAPEGVGLSTPDTPPPQATSTPPVKPAENDPCGFNPQTATFFTDDQGRVYEASGGIRVDPVTHTCL
jgi:hypothetical protein